MFLKIKVFFKIDYSDTSCKLKYVEDDGDDIETADGHIEATLSARILPMETKYLFSAVAIDFGSSNLTPSVIMQFGNDRLGLRHEASLISFQICLILPLH